MIPPSVGTPGRELREAMWLLRALREKKSPERIATVLGLTLAEVPARIDLICAWALQHGILDAEAAPDGKGNHGQRRRHHAVAITPKARPQQRPRGHRGQS